MTDWTSDCGTVRLILGDCLEVLPTLDVSTIGACITDPPYGVRYKNKRQDLTGKVYADEIRNDESQGVGQSVVDFCFANCIPCCVFAYHTKPFQGKFRQHLVWDKGPAVGGGGDPPTCWKYTWELIQVGGFGKLNGQRDSAVLRFWIGQGDMPDHPTQKPVELMEYLLGKLAARCGVVADPFMGSGSTGVAAIRLGMRFVGIECFPEYYVIAKRRCQDELRRVKFLEPEPQPPRQQLLSIGEDK